MSRALRFALFFSVVSVFLLPARTSFAATQPQPARPVADKPAVAADRSTTVAVEHEGTDTLGAKLAFQLKGTFNSSSLFSLSEKDEPKIKVLLSTAAEFPSRPNLASVYAAVWVFSQADGTLSFTLARDVGLVTADDLDALVARLTERTDGIAVKYGYLFKN